MPLLKRPRKDMKILRTSESPTDRRPIAVSLGPAIVTSIVPHPDQYDTEMLIAGLIKRVAFQHPQADPKVLKRYGEFILNFLENNFTPLDPDTDITVDKWLEDSEYPLWRKEEIKNKYLKVTDEFDPKYKRVMCFAKDEPLEPSVNEEFKYVRNIFARTDEFKAFVGPYFKAIEKVVYNYPAFVKHIPVSQRPEYIQQILNGGGQIDSTDYTAFESQFNRILMEFCEIALYKHMTKRLPTKDIFWRHLKTIVGKQKLVFKWLDAILGCCRMSGEMCTSLGNGFTNLMNAMFVAHEKGCSNLRIVIEGDDGLMRYDGPKLSAEDFALLGLTIKMEHHDRIETASFCGIIFDSEEQINLTDPRYVLATFGWGNTRYSLSRVSKLRQLLRCKALSLAHQYPGCPIISSLAHYGLRCTRNVRIGKKVLDSMTMWDREKVKAAIRDEKSIKEIDPGPRSRALMEQLYDISIEVQLKIEAYFNSKDDVGPIVNDYVRLIMPDCWSHYSSEYVRFVMPSEMRKQSFSIKDPYLLSDLLKLLYD